MSEDMLAQPHSHSSPLVITPCLIYFNRWIVQRQHSILSKRDQDGRQWFSNVPSDSVRVRKGSKWSMRSVHMNMLGEDRWSYKWMYSNSFSDQLESSDGWVLIHSDPFTNTVLRSLHPPLIRILFGPTPAANTRRPMQMKMITSHSSLYNLSNLIITYPSPSA